MAARQASVAARAAREHDKPPVQVVTPKARRALILAGGASGGASASPADGSWLEQMVEALKQCEAGADGDIRTAAYLEVIRRIPPVLLDAFQREDGRGHS